MPILEGTDGVEKMSKSLDNYIGISEAPEEMYGKTLSIPDELIYRYYELGTDVPTSDLPAIKERAASDPRNAKHDLAWTIVRIYHGEEAANAARRHFEKVVIQGGIPDDVEDFAPAVEADGSIGLLTLLSEAGLTASNSEARRMVQQNAVSIDGEKVTDAMATIDVAGRAPFIVQVGKRKFKRITR
jgi:tyrosyl-tRNA synthetase